ncbi:HAD-IB family hydrolase [Foetidibacter luteolus]|uniref:HAD-IB family hydrolase n=1 Tax=Foetidibacter luteolus TaxID=2608880 RepID=UPI001A9998EB|nr:HAD-IB family hydrolase [Foetidibacter luteolus]
MGKTLVLFDFDGTITYKDTLFELIKYHKGSNSFYMGMMRHFAQLALHKTGFIASQPMKEMVMTHFWKGTPEKEFTEVCASFSASVLPGLLRSQAIETIQQYQQKGHDIAIVSASAEDWVMPFCNQHSLTCLSSRLEKKDGRLTGKLLGLNCNGPEKVSRVKAHFNTASYSVIIAYGDTNGDKPMLQFATEAHYKPFR